MKLLEIQKDWMDGLSDEQIRLIKTDFKNINKIPNPSEELQMKAVKYRWNLIFQIPNPADSVKEYVLTLPHVVTSLLIHYNELVEILYPNNELMQKKWIRFGNRVRGTDHRN